MTTQYVLKPEVVQSCVSEISSRTINSVFAGYLGVKRAYAKNGEDSTEYDASSEGVQFDLHEYFNRYYRVDGRSDAHFVPFTEKNGALEKNLWLKHAPGTYTPSSAPPSFEKVVEITGSRSDAKYKLKEDHWETVLNEFCDGMRIPVDAVAGFLYRDFALEVEEADDDEDGDDDGEEPSVDLLLEAFRGEFGYEEDGEEYTDLYEEGTLGIDKESFIVHE
jgi:hypothetical protein